jgi:hypothetical protein
MTERPDPYSSFVHLVEDAVLPRLLENPQHARLDGRQAKDVWEVVGRFAFDGDVWELYVDNHYEPLLLAYWSAKFRGEDQTFERADMKQRQKLVLAPDLRALRPTGLQHLYLYQGRAAA